MSIKIKRPWIPKKVAFETGRVKERWKGYNTTRWRKIATLHKQDYPLCSIDGCDRSAYYTDHIIPVTQCSDPYDVNNLQSLCRMHGDKKTGAEGSSVKHKGRGV